MKTMLFGILLVGSERFIIIKFSLFLLREEIMKIL